VRGVLRAFSGGLDNLHLRQTPRGPVKIDWSHPLAQGLIGCWLPGISGGIDLTGINPSLVARTASKTGVAVEGPGLVSDAVNTGMKGVVGNTSPLTTWTDGFSIYYRGYKLGSGNNNCDILSIFYDSAGNFPFNVAGLTDPSTGQVATVWNHGGSLSQGTAKSVNNPGLNSLGGTFKVGGNAVLYQSGVATDTTAFGSGAPTSTATSTVCIDTRADLSSQWQNSVCYVGYFWNRELSADEMAMLDADPYGFLVPAEGEMPQLFFQAPAGGAQLSQLLAMGVG